MITYRYLNKQSTLEDYQSISTLDVGTVVKVDDYDTVIKRVEELLPKFELYPITAGTDLFTTYGSGYCVITNKGE